MSRNQHAHDNWALLFSQKLALEKKKSLVVVFNLVPDLLEATIRQYKFMLKGLRGVERINSSEKSKKFCLEELIIRRELSDNFCYFNKN